jgi:hypothetical protein
MKLNGIVTVLGAETLQDLRDMGFHAVRRDTKVLRDLFVRETRGEEFEDILLARRERARVPRTSASSPSTVTAISGFHRWSV